MSLDHDGIVAKLDNLAAVRKDIARLWSQYENRRETIMGPVKEELDALKAEWDPLIACATALAAELETDIKRGVEELGASVKGGSLHAVFSNGRVTWDAKAIDVYSLTHPEILPFRKEGNPSVSIREAKGGV